MLNRNFELFKENLTMLSEIQMMKSTKKGANQSIMDIQSKTDKQGKTLMDEAVELS